MPANRSDIDDAREREWYGNPRRKAECANCGASFMPEARTYFNSGWSAGARWAIFYSTQLSPMFNKFVQLLTYLWPEDEPPIPAAKSEFADITPQIEYWKERK